MIRPTDYPASPPGQVRPAHPEHPAGPPARSDAARSDAARSPRPEPPSLIPADPDVYVYRDTSGPDPEPAAPDPVESEAAYWYDVLAEEPAQLDEPTRGPFEPLVSSAGPPPGAAAPPAAGPAPSPADAVREEDVDDSEHARARKLEQLKDLYLTAEAIGEHNVDKHFDQLLAQQRELISGYFRQSPAARSADPTAPETAQPGTSAPTPGPAVASPRDGLAAESEAWPRDPRDPGAGRDPGTGTPEDATCTPPRGW